MSSQAPAKPVITKNSSEFKLDLYASLSTLELVVFAVQVLQVETAPVAVEEVVSTCFRFFPHSFALKNYFYWPDSALVTRRLHDAKEKGFLKGGTAEGFETKVQGRQAAKHVAKALGVSLSVPPKVEVIPAPVEAKLQVETPHPTPDVEKPTKKVSPPEAKKKPVRKRLVKPVKKAAPKQPAQKKPKAKPAVLKKKVVSKPKPAPTKKKQAKALTPAPVKKEVVKKEVKKPRQKIAAKPAPKLQKETPKPTQLTLALAPAPAKKKAHAPASKPKPENEAKPVKPQVIVSAPVSKEEKVKAGKVIKQVERSDAYRLYKQNGKKGNISEFDFRNMLFATMESSAETLKRNVELFKRYADIEQRKDVITFLDFCEIHFASLLKRQINKPLRRLKL